jgi:hypothetical protein
LEKAEFIFLVGEKLSAETSIKKSLSIDL